MKAAGRRSARAARNGPGHLDARGRARMVDIGVKPVTLRVAVAEGSIRMSRQAFLALRGRRLAKGDAVAIARIAGVAAAKRTSEWIPLCHAIPLDYAGVEVRFGADGRTVVVQADARARFSTGVEMEAMVAVVTALLTLYDMAKAIDRGMSLEAIHLLRKSGGRSGEYVRKGRGVRAKRGRP